MIEYDGNQPGSANDQYPIHEFHCDEITHLIEDLYEECVEMYVIF